jgi:hypothetical protein
MTNTNKASVIIGMALALLLACAGRASADEEYLARRDSVTAGLGNSVAHNRAVHTIDPWPRYVGNDKINIDGRRIQLGMRRYQANKSIPPRGFSTSSSNFYNQNGANGTPAQSDTDYGATPGNSPDNK